MKSLVGHIFIGMALLSLFFSCSSGQKRKIIAVDEVSVKELTMEKLLLLPDPISPHIYMLSDDYLLLLPFRSSTIVRIYDVKQGTLQTGRLNSAESKIEIGSDPGLHTSISFLNPSTSAYSEYQIADGCLSLKRNTAVNVSESVPDDVVRVEENLYVTLGNYPEGLFGVLNGETQYVRFYGRFPYTSNKYRSGKNFEDGYMSMHGNRLYYATRYFGYIASYTLKDKKIQQNWQVQLTDFNFKGRANGIEPEHDKPLGFEEVIAKEKYVYTLYTPDFGAQPEESRHSLLIFDLKGTPVVNCKIPQRIDYFTIDNQEKYMYAVYEISGESWLVRFRLPE